MNINILSTTGKAMLVMAPLLFVAKLVGEEPQLSSTPTPQEISLDELQTRADAGDAQAAYEIASRYYEGNLRPYDPSKTFRYAKIAAETGSCEGRMLLAELLVAGSPGICKRDIKGAGQIFTELYESGYIPAYWAYATVLIGKYGKDIRENTPAGKDALKKIHEILDAAIDAEGDSASLAKKGAVYMNLEHNLAKAEEYLKRAANLGNRSAKFSLAVLYIEQYGRIKEGLNYLMESAGQGHPQALYRLAGYLSVGLYGLQGDDALISNLIEEAIARGDIGAELARVDYLVDSYFGETELTDADIDCLEDAAYAGYIPAKLLLEQWGKKEQEK